MDEPSDRSRRLCECISGCPGAYTVAPEFECVLGAGLDPRQLASRLCACGRCMDRPTECKLGMIVGAIIRERDRVKAANVRAVKAEEEARDLRARLHGKEGAQT